MLKRIPKSDISIRPFKAYKEWIFYDHSSEIDLLEAKQFTVLSNNPEITSGSNLEFYKHSIYGELRAQFYNGKEDDPFHRSGHKTPYYNDSDATKERFLSGSAKVISIPQKYIGEGIKKGTVTVFDGEKSYIDDSYGNLISSEGDSIVISLIDTTTKQFNFVDIASNVYSASMIDATDLITALESVDLENEILRLKYNGINYLNMSFKAYDVDSGTMVVNNIPFLAEESAVIKIGNVFYTQGLIVLTRDSNTRLLSDWEVNYRSTQTIYENEFLLIVNPDEFNVSTNPSAIVKVGEEVSSFTDSDGVAKRIITNPGVKYIRKLSTLENGSILDYRYQSSMQGSASVKAGFESYDISSSIDTTGSYLAPFVTTIGLYDDNCDLMAVAKLPQPIKSYPDMPVNFIVRFDT